jgi:hypothetical protein
MPATPKSGPALFLGIELATDQLRASIVDESLELVGVECVDFDTELDYQCVLLYPKILGLPQKLMIVLQNTRRYLHNSRGGIYNPCRNVDQRTWWVNFLQFFQPLSLWVRGLAEPNFQFYF